MPVEREVDAFDERVLRDDKAVTELRCVVGDPLREAAPLELGEQARARRGQRASCDMASTSTGPFSFTEARPSRARPASAAASAAPRAASSSDLPCASSAASVAECVQPAPCVAATSCRSTGISTCRPGREEVVHRALAVAAGDEHGRRAERVQLLGQHAPILGLDLAERLCLVEVRRDDGREREEPRHEGLDRVVLEQLRTAGRDHHRVDDERDAAARARKSATVSMIGREKSMPVFAASTPMSEKTASSCARDELRRHLLHGGHADGVLRGQRHDRAHAEAAGRGERLEVGLDAGAAAGIGARDGQAARDRHGATLAVRSQAPPSHREERMAETYTHTTWRVKPGSEDEFVRRWKEWIEWSHLQGLGPRARLLRDAESPSTFVELRSLDEHGRGEELARGARATTSAWRAMQELLEGFEPRTLDVVAEG